MAVPSPVEDVNIVSTIDFHAKYVDTQIKLNFSWGEGGSKVVPPPYKCVEFHDFAELYLPSLWM